MIFPIAMSSALLPSSYAYSVDNSVDMSNYAR